jgi:precorrin-2 dehydrogenase/sirohydrochlorin ferrochelatase
MGEINEFKSPYYPVFLDLQDKKVVVAGGGRVAERKVLSLVESGASVTVISPEITETLSELKNKGLVFHIKREYKKRDLKEAFMVIAATSSKTVNQQICQDAPYLVNVIDDQEACNFIVPSVIRRQPLMIAVSTQGYSPALSKTIRQLLEQLFPTEISGYLQWLSKIRHTVKSKIENQKKREELFRKLASSQMLDMLRNEGVRKTLEKAEQLCEEYFAEQ